MSDLEVLFETMKQASKAAFEEFGGCIPMFITIDPPLIVPAPWNDLTEKQMQVAMIKALFKENNVQRYGFAFEAWFASYNKPDNNILDVTSNEFVTPSQRLDRQEYIMVVAEEKGLPPMTGMWEINRDKKGRGKIGNFEINKDIEAIGAYRNMLGMEVLQ